MKRENTLDGRYFVILEHGEGGETAAKAMGCGLIIGEAAEGWFLAELFDSNRNPVTQDFKTVSQSLMRIEELKGAEFFAEIADLGNRIHYMKCGLSRLPNIDKSENAG